MSDRATRDWEHYSENVEAILTDLIAELRQLEGLPCTCTETVLCVKHSVFRLADRAEARLKGLNDE